MKFVLMTQEEMSLECLRIGDSLKFQKRKGFPKFISRNSAFPSPSTASHLSQHLEAHRSWATLWTPQRLQKRAQEPAFKDARCRMQVTHLPSQQVCKGHHLTA